MRGPSYCNARQSKPIDHASFTLLYFFSLGSVQVHQGALAEHYIQQNIWSFSLSAATVLVVRPVNNPCRALCQLLPGMAGFLNTSRTPTLIRFCSGREDDDI